MKKTEELIYIFKKILKKIRKLKKNNNYNMNKILIDN